MRNNLTKKDLINSIYMQLGFSKKIIEILIDDFFEILIDKLITNNKVKMSNFGTFVLKNKKERIGRNPKTKEEFLVSKRKSVRFSVSKNLSKILNK